MIKIKRDDDTKSKHLLTKLTHSSQREPIILFNYTLQHKKKPQLPATTIQLEVQKVPKINKKQKTKSLNKTPSQEDFLLEVAFARVAEIVLKLNLI